MTRPTTLSTKSSSSTIFPPTWLMKLARHTGDVAMRSALSYESSINTGTNQSIITSFSKSSPTLKSIIHRLITNFQFSFIPQTSNVCAIQCSGILMNLLSLSNRDLGATPEAIASAELRRATSTLKIRAVLSLLQRQRSHLTT